MEIFYEFLKTTAFAQMTLGNGIMILIGLVFIALAIFVSIGSLIGTAIFHKKAQ